MQFSALFQAEPASQLGQMIAIELMWLNTAV